MSKRPLGGGRHDMAEFRELVAKAHRLRARINAGKPDAVYWTELVERTEQQRGRAKEQMRLVRYLVNQDKRSVSLERLVSDFYGLSRLDPRAQEKAERQARRHVERTREALEHDGCPLRLEIRAGVVRLLDAS